MNTDISKTTDKEIQEIIEKLKAIGYKQEDECYVSKGKLGLVLYPALLCYSNAIVPWISVKMGFENIDESNARLIALALKIELESIGYTPFKDEDAFAGCASIERHPHWIEIKLYINPDFPNGLWENHTL
jgi:hypothetical protein